MKLRFGGVVLALGLLLVEVPSMLPAQSAVGAIDFTAQVAPTGGRPEPVRQMTFYALRKSLDAIRQEAAEVDPPPNFDKFVDGLSVSPGLKAWMKKHHTVQLSGTDFVKTLTGDDIVNVPEFHQAYISRNSSLGPLGFPKPKFKEKDRTAHPEKYKQEKQEYEAALRKFIKAMPETLQGLDTDLGDLNPYPKWARMQDKQRRRLEIRTLDLAQQRYLAAQADTDLDGRGLFQGLAPGNYWITSLGMPAEAGDVRLLWDVRVTVHPGEVTRLALNNLNAVQPYGATSYLDR